jgi:hypothetical protein
MIEQCIRITKDKIYIAGHLFVHKDFSVTNKELIFDAMANFRTNQPIHIYFHDGENLQFTNFLAFIEYMCSCFSIPVNQVTVESHCDNVAPFNHVPMIPGIFISVNQHLPEITHDVAGKKFVGTLLGRFTPSRLRLAYELDRSFPDNNFTVFQPHIEQVKHNYRHVSELYAKELTWLENKTFDHDMTSNHMSGTIDWTQSCQQYGNVCNNYQIEIISETDPVSDFWFTEKTARCLATGKPFVLLAGKKSLRRIRDMGFKTFEPIIDETYDLSSTPTWRISSLIHSLERVYNSINRDSLIEQLYSIAAQNIEIYKNYIATHNK